MIIGKPRFFRMFVNSNGISLGSKTTLKHYWFLSHFILIILFCALQRVTFYEDNVKHQYYCKLWRTCSYFWKLYPYLDWLASINFFKFRPPFLEKLSFYVCILVTLLQVVISKISFLTYADADRIWRSKQIMHHH